MVLYPVVGQPAFSRLHRAVNPHMPPGELIEYSPQGSVLTARYRVKESELREWAAEYELAEEQPNTFSSKIASNGQGLVAEYDPRPSIVKIRYHAF